MPKTRDEKDENVLPSEADIEDENVPAGEITLESLHAELQELKKVVAEAVVAKAPLLPGKFETPVFVAPTVPFTGKEKAEESVTFHLNDGAVPKRTFSVEDHGEGFLEVANEFHKTNERKITKRVDN